MSHCGSSVRQNTSGENLASCWMTWGVCEDGSRLILCVTTEAANATVKRYRSAQTLRTCLHSRGDIRNVREECARARRRTLTVSEHRVGAAVCDERNASH